MKLERPIRDIHDLKETLARINFEDSCIDMGWKWESRPVYTSSPWGDLHMVGYQVRTTFRRPDRDTKEVKDGFGRWWDLPITCTSGSVVKTAFLACQQILVHELMEAVHYDGIRVFDPHHDLDDLAAAARHNGKRFPQ